MWWNKRAMAREREALSAMPKECVDLTGACVVVEKRESGDAVYRAELEQCGVSVFGTMQSKLAAYHPLHIRGLVFGATFGATYWRPPKIGMGSGLLQLALDSEAPILEGTASWYDSASAFSETFSLRWERSAG